MELLLNPNIGYLLMMGGILLAMLALLTPGTGLLELAAVIALALVGVQLFIIPVNLWALGIVGVGAVLYVIAVWRRNAPILLAVGLVLIFVGAALIYSGDDGLFGVNPWLILIVSLAGGSFMWVVTRKVLSAAVAPPLQDLSSLIGKMGVTRTPVYEDGTIYAAGEEWSARSTELIPRNNPVEIVGREGFILLVERADSRTVETVNTETDTHVESTSGG